MSLDPTANENDSINQVVSTIRDFLDRLCYKPIVPNQEDRRRLEAIVRDDLARHIHSYHGERTVEWLDRCCTPGVAFSQMIYPEHDFEELLYMSRLTTWLLYFDDMAQRMPSSLEAFQRNLITNEGDLEIMVAFRRLLADAYRLRDPISANLIVTSCMEFITGCAIEGSKELSSMKVRETAASWPYFLRARTGVAHAFSFMIFPKKLNFELPSYIQIMGDANLFIELTNDVLSFHKENLAGETTNYVSNRAYTSGKSAILAHKDIAEDVISAYHRVCATLDEPQLEVWKKYANGNLAFHVAQKRYHLDEILSF